MNEIALLIFLGIIFFFLYKKDRDDKISALKREEDVQKRHEDTIKLFDNTVRNVLDQVESNTEKFYEMTGRMQIKHFENLERHTSKLLKFIDKPVQVKEVVRKLEELEANDIAKEEIREDPLSDDNRVPIVPGLNVQFEGEEQVHPIEIS